LLLPGTASQTGSGHRGSVCTIRGHGIPLKPDRLRNMRGILLSYQSFFQHTEENISYLIDPHLIPVIKIVPIPQFIQPGHRMVNR
jgi:hypothetical protein